MGPGSRMVRGSVLLSGHVGPHSVKFSHMNFSLQTWSKVGLCMVPHRTMQTFPITLFHSLIAVTLICLQSFTNQMQK